MKTVKVKIWFPDGAKEFKVPEVVAEKLLGILTSQKEVEKRRSSATLKPSEVLKHISNRSSSRERGASLRRLRENKGISQGQLAKDLGIARSNLTQIESGKRPIGPKMRKLFAEYFKVTPDLF